MQETATARTGRIGERSARALEYGLQPALLASALLFWSAFRGRPEIFIFALVAAQLVLGTLERFMPARAGWVQRPREKLTNLAIVVVFTAFAGVVSALYREWLSAPLAELRGLAGLDLWPVGLPLAVRILIAFLASELVWYTIHRSEHRVEWLWRLSGHGVHHSFKRLNAINFSANHPLEAFVTMIPITLLTLLLGAGEEAGAAALLVGVNASVVHANLRLNSSVVGWIFTTNAYHFRHHSSVLAESNTNYGCASILWDRLFGTFAQGPTQELGIGPSEPRLWEKLLLPIRQPRDVTVAP